MASVQDVLRAQEPQVTLPGPMLVNTNSCPLSEQADVPQIGVPPPSSSHAVLAGVYPCLVVICSRFSSVE